MSLTISSDWLEFLEKLNKKTNGEALCYYQSDLDFLYVICGDGSCSDWDRLIIGQMIFKGADVIEKMYPGDCENGDTFAGLEIWGGVQSFLSYHYKLSLGEDYEAFRQEHNLQGWKTTISEIIDFVLKDKRMLVLKKWQIWEERVNRALKDQSPEVHIPLIPIK